MNGKLKRTVLLVLAATIASAPVITSGSGLSSLLEPFQPRERPRVERPAAEEPAKTETAETRRLTVDQRRMVDLLTAELHALWELDGDLTLVPVRGWDPVTLSGKKLYVELIDWPRAGASPHFSVRFRVYTESAGAGEHQLGFRAELRRDAWVAARRINRGDDLGGGALEIRRVDVLRDRKSLLPLEAVLANYEGRQPLQEGQPVGLRDVAPRPVVRRGQVVDVVLREGPIFITMKGQVMENGGVGETVSVRNPGTRREFTAEVIDDNTVHVF